MANRITHTFDRLLERLAPSRTASAAAAVLCYCRCSDACFYCCEKAGTLTCNVATGGQCM